MNRLQRTLSIVNSAIGSLSGFQIVSSSCARQAGRTSPQSKLYDHLSQEKKEAISPYLPFSRAQIAQDLFVLSETYNSNTPHYFVEFGATDGIKLSNTYMLEKHLGWTGILAEPAKIWKDELSRNRQCHLDFRCVAPVEGQLLPFVEVGYQSGGSPELSGMVNFSKGDHFARLRAKSSNVYQVKTVTLEALLCHYNAPYNIGYLSIDTEGSELAILQGFPFDRYRFDVITVEHGWNIAKRKSLFNLLLSNGYVRKHRELSCWDDWYVCAR
jgi:hypothetical protein